LGETATRQEKHSESNDFHNPQCGTSRKALALLEERGAHVTVVEFLKTPTSRADLERIYDRACMTPPEGLRAKEPLADTLPSIIAAVGDGAVLSVKSGGRPRN